MIEGLDYIIDNESGIIRLTDVAMRPVSVSCDLDRFSDEDLQILEDYVEHMKQMRKQEAQ